MPTRPSLAVLMDPLETIKPAKDSTIAMLKAAAKRGLETLVFGQADLWARDGRAFARLTPLEITGDATAWYRTGEAAVRDLAAVDAVLMRKDPPFDMEYIYSTYLLERAEAAGTLVVNRPQGLRDMNEKAYTAWFPECCAPTLITRDMASMEAFLGEHGRAVFKPLDGMGGRSIFVVSTGDPNTRVVLETLTDGGGRYAIAQRYLP
jgi:glutathione synthase